MMLQKILEGMIPAALFLYLFGTMALGGISLLAATLPVFTFAYAILGMIVFSRKGFIRTGNSCKAKK